VNQTQYQLLPNRAAERAEVIVQPVPHERTVSYKEGTRNGPDGILAATAQLEYYDADGGWSPFQHLGICVLPAVDKRLYEDTDRFHERLRDHVCNPDPSPHLTPPRLLSRRLSWSTQF